MPLRSPAKMVFPTKDSVTKILLTLCLSSSRLTYVLLGKFFFCLDLCFFVKSDIPAAPKWIVGPSWNSAWYFLPGLVLFRTRTFLILFKMKQHPLGIIRGVSFVFFFRAPDCHVCRMPCLASACLGANVQVHYGCCKFQLNATYLTSPLLLHRIVTHFCKWVGMIVVAFDTDRGKESGA